MARMDPVGKLSLRRASSAVELGQSAAWLTSDGRTDQAHVLLGAF
jgi:hypothetical protein